MKYPDWLKTVPVEIREDPLWNIEAYRLALFTADLAWHDITKLFRDGRTLKLAGQLFEAVGSVGANISEGYSRGHQKDRARFYEYALGSARESRTWYFDGRFVLGESVAHHRIQLHTQIIRLLLKMMPSSHCQQQDFKNCSSSSQFPKPNSRNTEHGTRSTRHGVPCLHWHS